MNLQLHLSNDSISKAEHTDRHGPLGADEIEFLNKTRQTVIAHLENIDARLERYASYFDVNEEHFDELRESVARRVRKRKNAVDLHALEMERENQPEVVYCISMGHSQLGVHRIEGGEVSSKSECMATVLNGHIVNASDLFNWMASTLHLSMPPRESAGYIRDKKRAKVVFATSHKLNEDGTAIARLSGGFREKRPTDSTFSGLLSDDPVTNVPIKALLDHAFKCYDVPAQCIAVGPTSYFQVASTVSRGYDPHAFMALNLSDGFSIAVTEWGHDQNATVRGISFDPLADAIPANNIDQNYNFMQCRLRASNPLGRMVSTESIADITRMAWYHINQELSPAICWENGSLTTAEVLTVVFEPNKAKDVLSSWLKQPVDDTIVTRFRTVANLVVRRVQFLLAAIIAGCAEASGRCYEAFGTSRCIVSASDIGAHPAFLQAVEDLASSAVGQGPLEIVLNNNSMAEGAAATSAATDAVRCIAEEH